MAKKKKNIIAKRRAQAKMKKQKRSKNKSRQSESNQHFFERPAISAIDAPPGFQAIPMTQGVIEYAKPLMDYVDKGIVKDPNEVYQIAMALWNYDISVKEGDFRITKKEIIKQIEQKLKLNTDEASDFFDMMVRRKEHLFPDEIQPAHPMTMFMRQEKHYIISEFNYTKLNLSDEIYDSTIEDEKVVHELNLMDDYIADGVAYDEWEDHFFQMKEKCKNRFENWLRLKNVKEYCEDFPHNIEVYLDFIFGYMHDDDDINLKNVTSIYIEEFFVDYLLRKVHTEPPEYITWPPAMKLFYQFLKEIGYIERPEKVTKLINKIEPVFVNILKERYS